LEQKTPSEIDDIIEQTDDEAIAHLARLYKMSLAVSAMSW